MIFLTVEMFCIVSDENVVSGVNILFCVWCKCSLVIINAKISKVINTGFSHFRGRNEGSHKLQLLTGFVRMGHIMYIKIFFLVLCLPSQVRTSNGAIHHDPQLSPSTCCNPLSASSPVTSFLVFLFSFSLPFFPRLSFLEGSLLSLCCPASFSVGFELILQD